MLRAELGYQFIMITFRACPRRSTGPLQNWWLRACQIRSLWPCTYIHMAFSRFAVHLSSPLMTSIILHSLTYTSTLSYSHIVILQISHPYMCYTPPVSSLALLHPPLYTVILSHTLPILLSPSFCHPLPLTLSHTHMCMHTSCPYSLTPSHRHIFTPSHPHTITSSRRVCLCGHACGSSSQHAWCWEPYAPEVFNEGITYIEG